MQKLQKKKEVHFVIRERKLFLSHPREMWMRLIAVLISHIPENWSNFLVVVCWTIFSISQWVLCHMPQSGVSCTISKLISLLSMRYWDYNSSASILIIQTKKKHINKVSICNQIESFSSSVSFYFAHLPNLKFPFVVIQWYIKQFERQFWLSDANNW